jgi:2-polyprenyl-3-methyl-5-hydroxy-6-metoxy-1,4-benzoquinol methylase
MQPPCLNIMFQEVPCLFCNQYHHQAVIEENGYRGVKCPTCQVIYISPRPNREDILKLYARALQRPVASFTSGAFARRLKAEYTLSIVQPHLLGRKALEIGPGAGIFLQTLRRHGYTGVGIELNGQLADFLNNTLNIPCEKRPLSVESFGKEKFDLIYHCDVLSHFYNPLAEFALMHAKLKDDGLWAFETGNLGEVHHCYYRWYPSFRYPEHLFFFGGKSLRLLLERTGFALISLHRYPLHYALLAEKFQISLKKILAPSQSAPIHPPLPRRERVELIPGVALKKFCRLLFHYAIDYFLPYRLGAKLPQTRTGQPQTLIVVARKARQGVASP